MSMQRAPAVERTLDQLREHLPELRQRYGVISLGVFGSFIHPQTESPRDIDILVEFDDRPRSLFDFIGLRDELAELLGADVDLVDRSVLKTRIGQRILRETIYV